MSTKLTHMRHYILTFATLLLVQVSFAQLSGNYTINSEFPSKKNNFSSLNEAILMAQTKGLDGDVVFELATGVYYEPIVIANLQNELGYKLHITANPNQSVLFQNDGLSVLISQSSSVTISNIQFESTTTELYNMVQIQNSANIVIRNSEFIVDDIQNSDKSIFAISHSSHNNVITNNLIKGNSGVLIERKSNNNKVSNNNIYFENYGVKVLSSTNTQIVANNIEGLDGSDYKVGILLDGAVGQIEINANWIVGVSEGLSQELIYRPSENKCSGEMINNIIQSHSNAIHLSNNIEQFNIAFNTVNSNSGSAILIDDQLNNTISKVNLIANNLVVKNSNPVINVKESNCLNQSDYNNFFCTNGQLRLAINGIEKNDLSDLNELSFDNNSISHDPLFIGLGANEFLLSEQSPLIDAGPKATDIGVWYDFDGDARQNITEIGADEFNRTAYDLLISEMQIVLNY